MGLSSGQEEISASNNNWSVVSGRLDIPLTSKRYTPEIMGLMGMRVLGEQGNEFRGCLDQDFEKLSFETTGMTVELKFKIRIFKSVLSLPQ